MTGRLPSAEQRSRRSVLGLLGAAPLAVAGMRAARSPRLVRHAIGAGPSPSVTSPDLTPADLDETIQQIINGPAFGNSRWGMEFSSLGGAEPLYSMNAGQLYVAASTAKVFTAAVAFSALGPGYRFRTPAYRTGPVAGGVLDGDLVLVASGDLLLSNRVQPDGPLALPVPDHSYDLPDTVPVGGDPLRMIRGLAAQVAARDVRRITGQVLVDASLFLAGAENIGVSAAGMVTISPIMINDDVVDVVVTPGHQPGAPGVLHISPETGYVRVANEVTTVAAPDAAAAKPLSFVNDVTNPDGTHAVSLTGGIPLNTQHLYRAYYIPDPVRFAEIAFAQALRSEGIDAPDSRPVTPGPAVPATHYTAQNRLAEHVSPPLFEEVKVMVKTSSNIHTVRWLYLLGAIAGRDSTDPKTAYYQLQDELFVRAGINPAPPGSAAGEYTPDFFVRFLTHLAQQPYFPEYRNALPIMGKDGSLASVQVGSPAAGHVFAKTGTGLVRQPPLMA